MQATHKGRYSYKTKDHSDLLPKEIVALFRENEHRCLMDVEDEGFRASCLHSFVMLSPFMQIEAEAESELPAEVFA